LRGNQTLHLQQMVHSSYAHPSTTCSALVQAHDVMALRCRGPSTTLNFLLTTYSNIASILTRFDPVCVPVSDAVTSPRHSQLLCSCAATVQLRLQSATCLLQCSVPMVYFHASTVAPCHLAVTAVVLIVHDS
jgi:hypothetical protein